MESIGYRERSQKHLASQLLGFGLVYNAQGNVDSAHMVEGLLWRLRTEQSYSPRQVCISSTYFRFLYKLLLLFLLWGRRNCFAF